MGTEGGQLRYSRREVVGGGLSLAATASLQGYDSSGYVEPLASRAAVTETPLFEAESHPRIEQEKEHYWKVRSVDMQKETQDALKEPVPEPYIREIVRLAKEVNATHIAIGTPYDTPPVAVIDTVEYTRHWTNAAHEIGLNVWHRHMPTQFEGFYDQPKIDQDYKTMIREYILSNPDLFADDDIFAPFPEPQNGGVVGINCHEQVEDDCQFDSVEEFNQELRDYVEVAREAFREIGKDVAVGYYGFDGFVVAGLNNPDWEGQTFLEPETVEVLEDTITIDHYTDDGPEGYVEDYTVVHEVFPTARVAVGELGPASHLPDHAPQEEVTQSFNETFREISELPFIHIINVYPFISGMPHESLIWVDFNKLEEQEHDPNANPADVFIRTPQFEITQEHFARMSG